MQFSHLRFELQHKLHKIFSYTLLFFLLWPHKSVRVLVATVSALQLPRNWILSSQSEASNLSRSGVCHNCMLVKNFYNRLIFVLRYLSTVVISLLSFFFLRQLLPKVVQINYNFGPLLDWV